MTKSPHAALPPPCWGCALHGSWSGEVPYTSKTFLACNFVNTHLRRISCIYSLSVHRTESSNMFSRLFCELVLKWNFTFIDFYLQIQPLPSKGKYYVKEWERLLLTYCLFTSLRVCLSWKIVLMRCCVLIRVTKFQIRAILMVHAGRI